MLPVSERLSPKIMRREILAPWSSGYWIATLIFSLGRNAIIRAISLAFSRDACVNARIQPMRSSCAVGCVGPRCKNPSSRSPRSSKGWLLVSSPTSHKGFFTPLLSFSGVGRCELAVSQCTCQASMLGAFSGAGSLNNWVQPERVKARGSVNADFLSRPKTRAT